MLLYDMHSHILPGIDDGCKTVEDSLAMINRHLKNGVNNICLTPHFYTNEESIEDFTLRRDEAYAELKPHIPDGVNVCLGTEVYISRFIFNNNDLSMLCYGNSNYMLTEFPYFSSFSGTSMEMLLKLRDNYGVTPVIPHIERYEKVFYDDKKLEELTSLGVVIQTNTSAFDGFLRKRRLLKLIKNGYIHILGTDAHSLSKGNPSTYPATCKLIREKCGESALRSLQKNASIIFNKTNV